MGNRVMRLERWRIADRRIDVFFWEREIVDGFFRHEREVRREEREHEAQLRREAILAEQHKVEERERRWKQFLVAAECSPWPNIEAADSDFIAAVTAAKASVVGDVSNEELQQAHAVVLREFSAKQTQCGKFLMRATRFRMKCRTSGGQSIFESYWVKRRQFGSWGAAPDD